MCWTGCSSSLALARCARLDAACAAARGACSAGRRAQRPPLFAVDRRQSHCLDELLHLNHHLHRGPVHPHTQLLTKTQSIEKARKKRSLHTAHTSQQTTERDRLHRVAVALAASWRGRCARGCGGRQGGNSGRTPLHCASDRSRLGERATLPLPATPAPCSRPPLGAWVTDNDDHTLPLIRTLNERHTGRRRRRARPRRDRGPRRDGAHGALCVSLCVCGSRTVLWPLTGWLCRVCALVLSAWLEMGSWLMPWTAHAAALP